LAAALERRRRSGQIPSWIVPVRFPALRSSLQGALLNTSRSPSSLGLASKSAARSGCRSPPATPRTASFAYTSAPWAEVAGLLSSGKIRLGPLITYRFPPHRFEDAYQALRESGGPRGKVMLDVTPA
jgi:hypothetical protein